MQRPMLLFPKSIKGLKNVEKPDRVIALGQVIAILTENKCVKLYEIIELLEVIAKVDVFHDDEDNQKNREAENRALICS